MYIQFVLPLLVAAFCAVNAADLCMDRSQIKSIDTVDVTKGDHKFYYCQSAVKGKNINYCSIEMHGHEDNTSAITAYYYDIESDMPKKEIFEFGVKKMDNLGEYDVFDAGEVKAMTYVLDMSKDNKCMTYMKCFSNGKWAGSEDSGAFVARFCADASLCADKMYETMVEKMREQFLPEGVDLEDTPQDKCKELGMI